jgi:hypothetical protein
MMLVENQTGTTMRLIGNLTERLNWWIAMYKMALNYEARERRRPSADITWNGQMIGDLRRRSSDV